MKVAEVDWQTNVRVSAVHSLRAVHDGRTLHNGNLHASLTSLLQQHAAGPDAAPHDWNALVARSLQGKTSDEIVLQAERALLQVYPDLAEQLRLRVRPIQEQWETCGTGLIRAITKTLGAPQRTKATPSVVLVQPVVGGAATAYPEQELVVMEAVLANSHRELPETLRLAWGLSQLIAHSVADRNESSLGEFATIPACLQVGEHFDLCRFDQATIDLAWQVWPSSAQLAVPPQVAMDWWQSIDSDGSWADRLGALASQVL